MNLTKYGPKGRLSPSLGDPCLLCGHPLAEGDYTTLVRRPTDRRYADQGAEVHYECAIDPPGSVARPA